MGFKGTYGESENGNFKVIDSIGVPHSFCITSRHVEIAADFFCGILGKDAIIAAEKKGIYCGIKGCHLLYSEHKQSLLIECYVDAKENKELKEYLLEILAEAEYHEYIGFAFLDKR